MGAEIFISLILVMSLLGAYKKKSTYDGYESLQLVDSGRDSFSAGRGGGGNTLAGPVAALHGPKVGPGKEEDCSTMDSSGRSPHTVSGHPRYGVCSGEQLAEWLRQSLSHV